MKRTERSLQDAELDLVLTISGQNVAPTVTMDPRDGQVISDPAGLGGGRHRLRITAKRDPAPLSVTGVTGVTRIFDVGLPVAPTVDAVVNAATGKPEGPAAKNSVVTIRGRTSGMWCACSSAARRLRSCSSTPKSS
jgi:hypothetical protein